MTRFCTRNMPTLFGVQFLLFRVSTVGKCFRQILKPFLGTNTIDVRKVEKLGPNDSVFPLNQLMLFQQLDHLSYFTWIYLDPQEPRA